MLNKSNEETKVFQVFNELYVHMWICISALLLTCQIYLVSEAVRPQSNQAMTQHFSARGSSLTPIVSLFIRDKSSI